ncbi:MAG: hypothetical protein ACJAVY_001333 [Marinoscillum sp.]|jgi:hypothetical protein
MARPTKQGIDYFPLDCQFDDKIEMYLIEKGATGLAVLVTLWQMIYSNEGYYIEDNNDLHLLIKRRIDVPANEVMECINACLSRNLFKKSLHESYGILTSSAIQKRYFEAAKKKKSVNYVSEFTLINVDSYDNLVSVNINSLNVSGNATKEEVEVKVKEKEEVEVNETKELVELKPDLGLEVFKFWKETMEHPRAAYDTKRKALIKKNLKHYSTSDLKKAIYGCSVTPHNMGDNKQGERYDSIELILRDAAHVDRFMKNSDNPPAGKITTIAQSTDKYAAQTARIRAHMEKTNA